MYTKNTTNLGWKESVSVRQLQHSATDCFANFVLLKMLHLLLRDIELFFLILRQLVVYFIGQLISLQKVTFPRLFGR